MDEDKLLNLDSNTDIFTNTNPIKKDSTIAIGDHCIWLFSSEKVTGSSDLVYGPLTAQYNNDATLFENEDGQTYIYFSGNGLFQTNIDLLNGKLIGNIFLN